MDQPRKFLRPEDQPPDRRLAAPSVSQIQDLNDTARELAGRRIESLRLYEPLPFQEAFHASTAKEVILQKGNQAGGSLTGYMEVARAVTGQDPYNKYPKENGVACCLGYGEEHIGKVIYPYLFMAGKFRIIKDLETGQWRTYRPWLERDRESETKPAPPLIPRRFIKGFAWNNKSKRIFNRCDLLNGWTIYAFNTSGMPSHAQGFTAALVHFDEDTDMDGWYDEMVARLSLSQSLYHCKGLLRWTAMPHNKNEDLVRLLERAEDEEGKVVPEAKVIKASIFDNPYYPKESLEDNCRIWRSQGEDVYRKRALGELTVNTLLMYPNFHKNFHNIMKQEEPRLDVQRLMADNNWEPPNEWTKYMVVDPGHSICAVTFWCVPPPDVGDFKICYDELYIRSATAESFGHGVAEKARNKLFQAFIIDAHGGRLTELGTGITPREQYTRELKKRGVSSVATRFGFKDGSDDIHGREFLVREWMGVRSDGTSKMLVNFDRCPNLVKEITRFKKKVV